MHAFVSLQIEPVGLAPMVLVPVRGAERHGQRRPGRDGDACEPDVGVSPAQNCVHRRKPACALLDRLPAGVETGLRELDLTGMQQEPEKRLRHGVAEPVDTGEHECVERGSSLVVGMLFFAGA